MLRTMFALSVVVLTSHFSRAEDLATILNYVPREANALMAVNVKSLMNSPLADKEGWKKRIAEETMIGLLPFPETAEYAVVAEQLQPGSLQGKWELVLISASKPFSFPDIAKAEKSQIEAIGQTPACFTRRNTVILQLSSTLLGVFSPAHRQDVSRWLKAQTGKPTLSRSLAQANDLIKAGNQVAILFDLEDTLDAARVKQFLAGQKDVQEKKLNVDALSKTFSSLSNVQFTIKVDQAIHGTMRTEFQQDITGFNTVLPGLIIAAFEGLGADLDEYRKGTVTSSAKAFDIKATLTPAGMRNTLALVQPHGVAGPMTKKTNKPEEDDPGREAQKTFRAIQSIANTAHEQAEKSSNIARAMVIYDNAGSRLDKLPVSQADEDLQQFSVDVSKSLREMASVLHSGVLEVQTLESKIKTNVNVTQAPSSYYMPNPWGIRFWNPTIPTVPEYNVQTNQPEIVAAQQEAITRAVRKRNEIWRQMVEKSATLKKALSTRYGLVF